MAWLVIERKMNGVFIRYDFAHPIQDTMEGITHSLCSSEFRDHRPLYEWVFVSLKSSWQKKK